MPKPKAKKQTREPLEKALTTAEVARRHKVSHHTALAWIHSGELEALDISDPRSKRRRYRILPSALEAFEKSRRVQPRPSVAEALRRKRKQRDELTEFV